MRRMLPAVAAILILVAVPACARGQAAPSAAAGKIAAVLQPFVGNHAMAGAVTLVADKDKILDLEAVGYADLAAKQPMRTDCVFWIASQSKPITAAALMILVDEGKLKLEDPVEKYLPEFRGQMVVAEKDKDHVLLRKPRHPITVRNVLSHTSGLPFKSPIEEPTLDLYPLALRRAELRHAAAGIRAGREIFCIPTRASTRPGGSSRSSAACPTKNSSSSGSSSRWG